MNHAYAVAKLRLFLSDVSEQLAWIDRWENSYSWPPVSNDLLLQEALARRIENAYVAGSGDYARTDNEHDHWTAARHAAIDALARASSADEFAAFVRPSSPSFAADGLHSWVWEPAAPLWAAEARQDAVLAAARTVNRRLQQKLDRHDVGEYDLAVQSFDIKDPAPGKPRLRFPGDRTVPQWKGRQEGAKLMTGGAYMAIRNRAAHEDGVPWTEQEALELLATFSVIARWIEECDVEKAAP